MHCVNSQVICEVFFLQCVNFRDIVVMSPKGGDNVEFYLILEEIMKEKGMNIPAVARACSLPDTTVRSIMVRKQKNVALEVAFKLSQGLGVSLQRLNGMPEPPKDKKNPPNAEGPEPEGKGKDIESIFNYLNQGLVSLGLIGENEDITQQQAEILIAVSRILSAAFQDG